MILGDDTCVGIYVNKNLRLDNIQVYGFDYDYTLAHYSSHLQSLIYDLAKQHMVNEVNSLMTMSFNQTCFGVVISIVLRITGS